MTEDLVSYDLAKALQTAGFDWPCDRCYARTSDGESELIYMTVSSDYNKSREGEPPFLQPICSAPTLWQAQKWLREKKGIAINVDAHDGDFYTWEAVFLSNASQDVLIEASLSAKFSPYVEKHSSYEAALSAGIASALELIKKGE